MYSGAKPDQTSVFYIELKEDKYLENDFSIENTQYIHKLFIVEEKYVVLRESIYNINTNNNYYDFRDQGVYYLMKKIA